MPKNVLVGAVKKMGPQTTISKASMLDLKAKQKRLEPKDDYEDEAGRGGALSHPNFKRSGAPENSSTNNSQVHIETTNSNRLQDELNSELPLVFTPVVDFWIGDVDFTSRFQRFDYSFEEEINEIGILLDSMLDSIIV